jgi:hypothetical protein
LSSCFLSSPVKLMLRRRYGEDIAYIQESRVLDRIALTIAGVWLFNNHLMFSSSTKSFKNPKLVQVIRDSREHG